MAISEQDRTTFVLIVRAVGPADQSGRRQRGSSPGHTSQIGNFGYNVRIFLTLADLKALIRQTSPDALLMDITFPEGKMAGTETIAELRQTCLTNIPVMFVSINDEPICRLQAVRAGGQACFTKPVYVGALIDALDHLFFQMAPELYRVLIVDDSPVQVGVSALYLKQSGMEAFIKSVNDTHGHSAGDRVLESLAHLLVWRLRGSDVVGRYGGEELAVILPNTTAQEAAALMDELRATFEKIRHRASGAELSATFSCGVSSFPPCQTPAALTESADRALYAAKAKGRNQVCLG